MGDGTSEQPADVSSPVPPTAPESRHNTQRQWPKRKKMIVWVTAVVLVALLIGCVLYWWLVTDGNDQSPKQTPARNEQQQTQQQTSAPIIDPTPVTYKSTKLNIELTHRKDWSMKESADGELTFTSPQTSYTDAEGQSATGVFTFKVRKGVSEASKAVIEKSIATKASEVIAYTAPTAEQRQYTNVSYVGSKKDFFNFFIVTGSTELKPGNSLAYTLPLDGEFYLFVGGYGTPGSNLAFASVPKEFMDSDTLAQAIKIVESIKIY